MTAQLPLPMAPRARRKDPLPSHAAADRAERFLRGHAAEIVAMVVAHPGRTARELERIGRLSVVQIDRRACELEASGWIRRTGQRSREGLSLWPTGRARRWARCST